MRSSTFPVLSNASRMTSGSPARSC
jgi:hypothetical protein